MAVQRRWKPMTGTALAAGVVLGGVFVYGQFGAKRPGGNPMNESRFPVHHVRLATDKPFEELAEGIKRQLGRFDSDVYKSLVVGDDSIRSRLRLGGPSAPGSRRLVGLVPGHPFREGTKI